ncbi:MAG: FAD-dependent oxidoreductase, partial [Acidobacteriia bacterium]|nr:FAD-dependent oxidoreductase [Terriglobia bacterium]
MKDNRTILTFSHLRWKFVYQRPQHLLSRLASSSQVIFIEEPLFSEGSYPSWEFERPERNILVAGPLTPSRAPGFHDEQMPYLRQLIAELASQENLEDSVQWFYTPMALPLADGCPRPAAVVYDCMDELSAFLNAPPALLEREAQLLERADLVFTGGPSLYRAKKNRHPRVHCFPSSVDAKHFAPATNGSPDALDQAALPHPRLGFFGVIDERIDLPLLAHLADSHPDWQLVMVGPVVKIDAATLPRRPNIHYYGQRSYEQLPSYLKGWDVCLLPFARNQATKYISPTKTLEYMAAAKMIVSTPITDVAEPYGGIVFLGDTPEQFAAACEMALTIDPNERSARREKMSEVLSRTSWDVTAARMRELIAQVADTAKTSRASSNPRTVVIGAGPTGLSAAYHLGEECLLLEQNDKVGGWCRSLEVNGFTFDFAGHIMFSNEPYVHQLYQMLLGANVHWQDREAWIYSKNVYTRYPFQGSLYGLPPAVIKECIAGAIEARFGPLKPARNGHANGANGTNGVHAVNGKTNGHATCNTGAIKDCCADGILEASVPLAESKADPRNFEEFIYKVWGAGIAKHFAIPYNRKLWAVPLEEMETSWLGGRVPLPDLEEIIEGALSPKPKPMGPNARFGYPLRGGFQALMDAWLPHLKGELQLNSRVLKVSPSRHTVTLDSGETIPYKYLVSTMPLPVLIAQMGDEAPAEI